MKEFTKRQIEILMASVEIISDSGIQNLTTRNLSDKIGISVPAIYRHFKNKNDILLNILYYFGIKIEKGFSEIISSDMSSLEKIEKLFMTQITNLNKNKCLSAIIFTDEYFKNEKDLNQEIVRITMFNISMYQDIIEKGQRDLEIKNDLPTKQLTLMLLGSLHAFLKTWRMLDYSFDLLEEGEKMVKTLIFLLKK
ncbi:MAG: TetR family transcriptional regulator [Candidatus Delongbacteria bacterium]|nr:TetR family transcriptional regulator [Candidatus Delongbacteria bacterium]